MAVTSLPRNPSPAAIHRGDRASAERSYAFIKDNGGSAAADWESPYVPVWEGTLNALLLADAGNGKDALKAASVASEYEASLPIDFGPQ